MVTGSKVKCQGVTVANHKLESTIDPCFSPHSISVFHFDYKLEDFVCLYIYNHFAMFTVFLSEQDNMFFHLWKDCCLISEIVVCS